MWAEKEAIFRLNLSKQNNISLIIGWKENAICCDLFVNRLETKMDETERGKPINKSPVDTVVASM